MKNAIRLTRFKFVQLVAMSLFGGTMFGCVIGFVVGTLGK